MPVNDGDHVMSIGGMEDSAPTSRDKLKVHALKKYTSEKCSPGFDIGRGTVSRSNLRVACKEMVMECSTSSYKRGLGGSNSSMSGISAASSNNNYVDPHAPNAFLKALRKLQHERLVVARLGFPEKAFELDQMISVMREKAKLERKKEEKKILHDSMKQITKILKSKKEKFEEELKKEIDIMEAKFNEEGEELLKRQERDFINCLKAATRRAIGRVKKCNCQQPYLCRHNKTASYNTRKPSKEVVQYRRNAQRLKQGGKPEEALLWQEKAIVLDQSEQEAWRNRVATGIVISPWGANEAVVDQMADTHRVELQALRKNQIIKRNTVMKIHETKRRNFENLITAERRR
eukprot:gene11296-23636_t